MAGKEPKTKSLAIRLSDEGRKRLDDAQGQEVPSAVDRLVERAFKAVQP